MKRVARSNVFRPNYRRYWLSLYRRDVATAERIVEEALECWPPQRIYLRLFEPALNLSGTLFARNVIGFSDEHFVTYHTLRFLRRVRRRFVPADPTGPVAIAAGLHQESHVIGLRMVCDFLQWANWRIHWLKGFERPSIRQTLDQFHPELVLLSLGLDTSVTPAQRLIGLLRREGYAGIIAVGGGAVLRKPDLVHQIGADLTAPNGLILLKNLRKLRLPVHPDRDLTPD